MSQALLQLQNVRKTFSTDEVDTVALAGLSLDIHQGEFVSITGPSGCGKSTLLSILGLLDDASAGSYCINGVEVSGISAAERARIRNKEIGFIFQAFNLIGDLSVVENVELPLRYRAGVSRSERRARAIAALQRVDMQHRQGHLPSQLSGGQQQRVAIARALVGAPSLLLADEPTGNLDSNNGEAVMELLMKLHSEGVTICMVTHDPRYAAAAQRNLHLFDGQLASNTTAAGVADPHPATSSAAHPAATSLA